MRRELIPGESRGSSWLWGFCLKYAQMLLLSLGLCLFFVTGFSVSVNGWLLYGLMSLLCLLFTVFFYDNWLTGARLPGAFALILAAVFAVLFSQPALISGLAQFGCAILTRMNARYGGDYMIPLVESNPGAMSVFFLIVFIPIIALLGGFTVARPDTMVVGFLLLPLLGLGLLLGASPAYISPVFVLIGILSVSASGRVGWQKSLWGEKDSPQWQQNSRRQKKISALSSLLICTAAGALMLPSFWILMPSLSAPLRQATPFAQSVEGYIAQGLLKGIDNFAGGTFSAPVSVFGGGVAEGSLTDHSGYLISGVEDLRLYATQKPEETIYLRGFVGGSYTQNRWIEPQESTFDAAMGNWETEGDPKLYVYNLPFLRMLYEQNESGGSASAQLTVERLNANDAYTYTPYGCYLNEYYEIQGGDGAVAGQKAQDDSFAFYFRADQRATLQEEYFFQNESSLDRLERSYSAYAESHYTAVPAGFKNLAVVCGEARLEDADLDTVIGFVQQYFWDHYTYSLTLPELPEGEDTIVYFLEESHVGASPQFASAATVMFRILGIPARYVVGYAASESLFTPQPDGTYQAVLQSDNAHAWVEVYISGTGWLPVETTPGQFGIVQDIEYFGNELAPEGTTPATTGPEETTQPAEMPEPPAPEGKDGGWVLPSMAAVLTAVLAVWLLHRQIRNLGLNPFLTPERKVRLIFAAYFRLLRRAGLSADVDSTSEAFPGWVKKLHPKLSQREFDAMMALVLESCFANRKVTEKEVAWMRKLYRSARKNVHREKKR